MGPPDPGVTPELGGFGSLELAEPHPLLLGGQLLDRGDGPGSTLPLAVTRVVSIPDDLTWKLVTAAEVRLVAAAENAHSIAMQLSSLSLRLAGLQSSAARQLARRPWVGLIRREQPARSLRIRQLGLTPTCEVFACFTFGSMQGRIALSVAYMGGIPTRVVQVPVQKDYSAAHALNRLAVEPKFDGIARLTKKGLQRMSGDEHPAKQPNGR